ncbi:imidazole glycerol phosphate synthase subunit HisH [Desulfurobacterium indicum]|uniref:Imidazole glycerol phosphate synthase subunit HisH n=1 Tax=Desulfurobacterium indicum TaxID=1914305 RepID=A0A1R1ML54_9BACT|nr:imidazole glycerol phosphate synthase subunit HisH [Desulfurobacterium indicum]OMH40493.1 imidazole glycerol phosphate synthase subunit HisH [Desulfurobacterium indicum]
MIAVIDYGMGNLRSVSKAVEYVGGNVIITDNKEKIKDAEAIILPGVGAFRDAVKNLKERGLWETVTIEVKKGKPFLGICLGLHLLFEKGYEFGEEDGLGIIKGKVVRFDLPHDYKIPHMGWNQVSIKKNSSFLERIKEGEFFYFVHSYYVKPEDKSVILTTTDYGIEFVSSIEKDNVIATQFHPEKSQKAGLKLLSNFLKLVRTS